MCLNIIINSDLVISSLHQSIEQKHGHTIPNNELKTAKKHEVYDIYIQSKTIFRFRTVYIAQIYLDATGLRQQNYISHQFN